VEEEAACKICREGIGRAGRKGAAPENIGREGISSTGLKRVEEAAGAGKICRDGINRAGRKGGSPDNIGCEGISIARLKKLEEAAGAGKIGREGMGRASCKGGWDNIGREGISIAGLKKVEEAPGAGNICRAGIGTNVVPRRQKNVTDGSVGDSSSMADQAGDRTNWKRAVSRSAFLSTTSRNTAQISSSNILRVSGF
jgi:hypothetical protein